MPKMILQRDRVVATMSGHHIAFKKGEETYVPPPAIAECMAVGAVPIEDFEAPAEENAAPVENPVATDPAQRKEAILKAFEQLRQRNARGDFDAAGKPHPKAISTIVGFTVEAKERNVVWTEYMEDSAK